jgi:hypothetical protein
MSLFVVRWNFWLTSRSSGAIHCGVPIRTVSDMSTGLANPKSAIFASCSLLTSMFAWTTTIAKARGNVGGSCSPLSNRHGIFVASVNVECPLQSEATSTKSSSQHETVIVLRDSHISPQDEVPSSRIRR